MSTFPRPTHRSHPRRHHGYEVDDPYAWLADPDDAQVLPHLRAENAYADAVTAPLAKLRGEIFEEIRARTQESDLSVPVAYRGWWYYRRTVQGSQYPIRARVPIVPGVPRPEIAAIAPEPTPGEPGAEPGLVSPLAPPGEQILLDGNVEA
ncbi:MAG: oligopeptidase B, partial [Micrococcales bacterium]|nr:oligopeptidase B [Micrococcales bacterium]